jgi:2-polyprenyl-3-methyl-5-hydroxy-6-metoxy-1,4-benzoquinol methylase
MSNNKHINIEYIDDINLELVNNLLPWQTYTVDASGRKFGKSVSEIKRNTPQEIPDRRIVELANRTNLHGARVLEIGCLEGIHTVALCTYGAEVTAVDSRIENVLKTVVRLWGYSCRANVSLCNVEVESQLAALGDFDVIVHIGVLYHLVNPVLHLKQIFNKVKKTLVLDTHFATDQMAVSRYVEDGVDYSYMHFIEGGRDAIYAGMYDHAKWLRLETLTDLIKQAGFREIDVFEVRNERNGPRVLIYANR